MKTTGKIGSREWAIEFDDVEAIARLRGALHVADALNVPAAPIRPSRVPVAPYLIDKFRGLKVEVFSNEHPPPHFRVKCGKDTANYTIKDCEQINGTLADFYSTIRKWHAENKQKLIEAWNARRPTDCPVGPYRD